MSEKNGAEKPRAPTVLDIFEGIRGRLPQTDRELEEWLASDAGKGCLNLCLSFAGARGGHRDLNCPTYRQGYNG